MNSYILLGGAIVAEVIATSALKASQGFSKPLPSLAVVVGYCVAFYLLSLTLKEIPVGTAYAIWSGAGTVLVALTAWIIFGQRLDAAAVTGMLLIVSGVVVMNLFSSTSGH